MPEKRAGGQGFIPGLKVRTTRSSLEMFVNKQEEAGGADIEEEEAPKSVNLVPLRTWAAGL